MEQTTYQAKPKLSQQISLRKQKTTIRLQNMTIL